MTVNVLIHCHFQRPLSECNSGNMLLTHHFWSTLTFFWSSNMCTNNFRTFLCLSSRGYQNLHGEQSREEGRFINLGHHWSIGRFLWCVNQSSMQNHGFLFKMNFSVIKDGDHCNFSSQKSLMLVILFALTCKIVWASVLVHRLSILWVKVSLELRR